jgi:hypothetical protein
VGVAVKVTAVPWQILLPGLALINTLGVTVGITVAVVVDAGLVQPFTVTVTE